jgi:signal transduction histidine kinase
MVNILAKDNVIFQELENGSIILKGEAPEWFKVLYVEKIDSYKKLAIAEKFPFLENFLIDAKEFWANEGTDELESGPWIEVDKSGVEYPLEATAINTGGKKFLYIALLGSDYKEKRKLLQLARDNILNFERLIKAKEKEISKLDIENKNTHNLVIQTLIQLVGGIAHEFNNPLAGLKGGAEALKDNIKDLDAFIKNILDSNSIDKEELDYLLNEGIPSSILAIVSSTNRLRDLINNLHRFSQLGEVDKREVKLLESINSILSQLEEKFIQNEIKVSVKISEGFVLSCFRDEIEIALTQILLNAIYYVGFAEKERKILIKARDLQNQVTISVLDNGCGVPKENELLVFQPFFTTKNIGQGVGLGLSVCLGIMLKHKGEIFVDHSRDDDEIGYTTKFSMIFSKI